jgi:hypothetical protein
VTLLLLFSSQDDAPAPGDTFAARPPTTLTLDTPDGVYYVKEGDTWPPLRMRAADAEGLIPVGDALSLAVRMLGPAGLITGSVEPIDADLEDGFNCRYVWAPGDTVLGRYAVELVITWATGRVETVPGFRGPRLVVSPALS